MPASLSALAALPEGPEAQALTQRGCARTPTETSNRYLNFI